MTVTVTRDGAVATVLIDRPERRNALDVATKVALRTALAEVAADDVVRAVVLAGAGGAFCVGQDLAEHAGALRTDASTSLSTVEEHYNPIVESIVTMPKPVIAAVEGACVGAGLGFALACDLRVFSSGAKLATAFTAIGLTCDSGLSATLTRAVGLSRATELVLLGATFGPAEATAWGISGTVVEPGLAVSSAQQPAARLAAGPTRAYAASKALLHAGVTGSMSDVLSAEGVAQARLGMSADHRGAVESFLAKEEPTFNGR